MLCASLKVGGSELLRRIDELDAAARSGATAGVPLLHPWANRLAGLRYDVAGREVQLDPASPLLHFDSHGLPIHGVPWSHLCWSVIEAHGDRLHASFEWNSRELLALFPFPHRLDMTAVLLADGLRLDTILTATGEAPVPASFGFHPYLGLTGEPRGQWRLRLPAMRHLQLDARGIPTGSETAFAAMDETLGNKSCDDGFALDTDHAVFALAGAAGELRVELIHGYTHAQVYAPPEHDYVALEPMTAPTAALSSGRGLRRVAPGQTLATAFAIRYVAV